jgi:ABC-type nickel/cobalt efflux system permease component RcnA
VGPFGVGRPEPALAPSAFGPLSPVIGWIAAQQAELYRLFARAVRAVRTDWTGVFWLSALAFAYGVLHAAGPGHGKVVVASYLLASRDTARRGAIIALASALAQGVVAIALVGVFALVLRASSGAMTRATNVLEIASYGLVLALGLVLLARKLASLVPRTAPAAAGGAPAATDDPCCAAHAIAPDRLAGRFDLKTAASAVLAVGLRPCTGAVLLLVFALAQGVFAAGLLGVLAMSLGTGLTVGALALLAVGAKGVAVRLAARRSAAAAAVAHAIEIAGALAVTVFGALFLLAALSAR